MKKTLLILFLPLLVMSMAFAQEVQTIKEEKKIIIKTIDEDGNITTKIIEGDEVDANEEKLWITEKGDSIFIDVEIEATDGPRRIQKRIRIPDVDENAIEKEIEMYDFDDEWTPGPHRFLFRDFKGPHPGFPGKGFRFFGDEEANKARLGVHIEDAEDGVKITKVVENGAAWSAGLMEGDVITQIDGKKMGNVEELQREVSSRKPGDFVEIKLIRNGKKEKATARLQSGMPGEKMEWMMMPDDFDFEHFGPRFQEGMQRLKHHCYRTQEECQRMKEHLDQELKFEKQEFKKQMQEKEEQLKEESEQEK